MGGVSPPTAQLPSNHLGPEGGTQSGFSRTPGAGGSCAAGPSKGRGGGRPFPECFWVGVSAEAPGGALNLPQECRRA